MKEVRQNKEYREIVDVIISEGGEMKVKDITACFSDVMATHVILLLAVQLVVLSEATIFIKPFPPNALYEALVGLIVIVSAIVVVGVVVVKPEAGTV